MNKQFKEAINSAYNVSGPHWAKDMYACIDETMQTQFQSYNDGKNWWIVFRATSTKWNWFTNFLFAKRIPPYENDTSPIRMHYGFSICYTSYLRKEIHAQFEKYRGWPCIVVGHSLGGALARICSVDLQYNFGISPKVRVFGCPNIGNKKYEESYSRRISDFKSYITEHDIVPLVPPTFTGYCSSDRIKVRGDKQFWKDHYPYVYFDNIKEDIWNKT